MEIADKLSLKGTLTLTARSVNEFDELMVEIEKLKENFLTFRLNVVAEWKTMLTGLVCESIDSRKLTAKGINEFPSFVNKMRHMEEEITVAINEGRAEDSDPIEYVFDCKVTLQYEKKDKEALEALKDPDQLMLFGPYPIYLKNQTEAVIKAQKETTIIMGQVDPKTGKVVSVNDKKVVEMGR